MAMHWLPALFTIAATISLSTASGSAQTNNFSIAPAVVTVSNTSKPMLAEVHSVEKDKPTFWLQTFITVLVSVATTIITSWFQERTRRKQMLEKEFVASIDQLRECCEKMMDKVSEHLVADPFVSKKQNNSHRAILMELKLCSRHVTRSGQMLEKEHRSELEAEFLKWKCEMTSAPFPVLKREFACKLHDASVQRVQSAQDKLVQYLDGVTRACLNGTITIPLRPKCN